MKTMKTYNVTFHFKPHVLSIFAEHEADAEIKANEIIDAGQLDPVVFHTEIDEMEMD